MEKTPKQTQKIPRQVLKLSSQEIALALHFTSLQVLKLLTFNMIFCPDQTDATLL